MFPTTWFGVSRTRSRDRVAAENFVRMLTGYIWDDVRDSVGASRPFRQTTGFRRCRCF